MGAVGSSGKRTGEPRRQKSRPMALVHAAHRGGGTHRAARGLMPAVNLHRAVSASASDRQMGSGQTDESLEHMSLRRRARVCLIERPKEVPSPRSFVFPLGKVTCVKRVMVGTEKVSQSIGVSSRPTVPSCRPPAYDSP